MGGGGGGCPEFVEILMILSIFFENTVKSVLELSDQKNKQTNKNMASDISNER